MAMRTWSFIMQKQQKQKVRQCISIATFGYLNEPPGILLVRAEDVMWGSAKEAAIAKRCKGLEETLQMPFNDSWPVAKRIQAIWQKMIDDKYVC
mmetsp:Transcript_14927/g.37230  ORF Transcript_14927/g.37230 Transcript_14927/m.37230 type:complete len:94 (-) Transcript_14927:633-914(-)